MLVEYGRLGHVGRFPGAAIPRDSAVVVRTPRGVELGRALRASPQGEAAGTFLRLAADGDFALAESHAARAEAILAEAVVLCAESPVAIVDCELPLEGAAILHVLPFAACDLGDILHILAGRFATPVRVLDVGTPPEPAAKSCGSGCGSGGCSTGGCSSCSTGGCSRKQVKSAGELTSYFAGLREQMDTRGRRAPTTGLTTRGRAMTLLVSLMLMTAPDPPGVAEGIKAMLAVGREGAGDEAAAAGWKTVVHAGPDALLPTLKAFPGDNPVALNWLRIAAAAIPAPEDPAPLLAFVRDESRHPAARRIAFDAARARAPEAAAKLLATRINDRDPQLRRDAIQSRLPDAKSAEELRTLFNAARDVDQCEALAKKLADAGVAVDLPAHYGVVTRWQLFGPLPAPKSAGLSIAYPADTKGYDLAMTVEGQGGIKVAWKPVQSSKPNGEVDFNEILGKKPDQTAFLAAEIVSPENLDAELRLGTGNAVKVYFNGVEAFRGDSHHSGNQRDQYAAKGKLVAGKNTILVKVCQNDQPESWAKDWQVAARLCDETGGALPVKERLPDGSLVPLGQLPQKESK